MSDPEEQAAHPIAEREKHYYPGGEILKILRGLPDARQRESVLRAVVRALNFELVAIDHDVARAVAAPVAATVRDVEARKLDNVVVSWWLEFTEQYHTCRGYPDVMTADGVTDYCVRTSEDFDAARMSTEQNMRAHRCYRMRQALMFHVDADSVGVWTWRIRWG